MTEPLDHGRGTKVALAMTAWRSYKRHQREADHWLKIFEDRAADLDYEERDEIRRRVESR